MLVWFDLSILFQLSLRSGKQNTEHRTPAGPANKSAGEPNPATDWFGFLLNDSRQNLLGPGTLTLLHNMT